MKYFEVDFQFTEDGELVLVHDWNDRKEFAEIPTKEEFLNTKILYKYTSMDFEALLNLMDEYKDIYIITDSKYTTTDMIEIEYNYIMQKVKELDKEYLLDRFIIQIYNEEMYYKIQEIYKFKNIIFTLYERWKGDPEELKEICAWCNENGVKYITMWAILCNQNNFNIIKSFGLDVYVHTINNAQIAKKYIQLGVKGIYTDNLKAEDVF